MDWSYVSRYPGVSVAYSDGKFMQTACRGYSDIERHITINENTLFPACSITKFITAICVMKMREIGLVDLDVDVNRYLTGWKVRNSDNNEICVTLRNILSHTAGFIDGEDGFYGHRLGMKKISLEDILEGKTTYNQRATRVENEPGKIFEYSDAGYCIVQMIIENITGKTYDEVVDEFVFRRLGMINSFVGTEENLLLHRSEMTNCYSLSGNKVAGGIVLCPDMAASSVWTNPKDLLILADEFYSNMKSGYCQEMLRGPEDYPWVGLGLFKNDKNVFTQGWGENGQCILKIDTETGSIGAVMINIDPEVSQEESGLEKMVSTLLYGAC